MGKLFLGLDSSTQSLSAVVIDLDAGKVIYEKSLNFDQALPQFKTKSGVLPNRDPLVKHSSPLLTPAKTIASSPARIIRRMTERPPSPMAGTAEFRRHRAAGCRRCGC